MNIKKIVLLLATVSYTSVALSISSPVTKIYAKPKTKVETLLRFHGSNTMGSVLLPALATSFMRQEGYSDIHTESGDKDDESVIVGERHGNHDKIEIQAFGSNIAFEDLKNRLCDIGMSSRRIKSYEQQALLPVIGDLTSNTNEHVIALDGIAMIVHPSNPINTLSTRQISDIFSGKITDWSEIGGIPGKIILDARDYKSGTYDFFNAVVLQPHNATLSTDAKRFEDTHKLSDSVYDNPMEIGFVGLSYVGANKVIAISDTDVTAQKPSILTIKTEQYLLSRRLYLYHADKPTNPNIDKFIEYAMGTNAQQIVAEVGLVNMDVSPIPIDPSDVRNQSVRWKNLTKDALAIETSFFFHVGSDKLDTRAIRDIKRIVGIMSQSQYKNKKLILIGFSDSSGTKAANSKLSQNRADIVRAALAAEGLEFLTVEGIGDEAFIAPNDSQENREKNRRVEVFIK